MTDPSDRSMSERIGEAEEAVARARSALETAEAGLETAERIIAKAEQSKRLLLVIAILLGFGIVLAVYLSRREDT